MASVGSDYRLRASVTPGIVLVGQPLRLTARTTEAWWPNPAATVSVTATLPDGSVTTASLFDDGAHADGQAADADFAADFTNTYQKGYYEFLVRSVGTTSRNEVVVREQLLTKYVGPPDPPTPGPGDCIPCQLLRWIIAFAILLLLAIFWLVWRCCCQRDVRVG
jgi:hypothetical protein